MGLTPFPANLPDDLPPYVTAFNDAWLPIILAALDAFEWEGFFDETPPDFRGTFDELNRLLMTPYTVPPAQVFPTQAYLFHDAAQPSAGNPMLWILDNAQPYGFWAQATTPANGVTFVQTVLLAAGTYDFHVLGVKRNNGGILNWLIDGSIIASEDTYAAGTTRNVEVVYSSIVIATDKKFILEGIVNGKNVSSSGFVISLTSYWFIPH